MRCHAQCLPWVSVSKGCAYIVSSERRQQGLTMYGRIPIMSQNFPLTVRNELTFTTSACHSGGHPTTPGRQHGAGGQVRGHLHRRLRRVYGHGSEVVVRRSNPLPVELCTERPAGQHQPLLARPGCALHADRIRVEQHQQRHSCQPQRCYPQLRRCRLCRFRQYDSGKGWGLLEKGGGGGVRGG